MVKLYHGSKYIIQEPKYGYGNVYNDYGLGFYCTQQKEMANEWAVTLNCDGFCNCYEIDDSDLKILYLDDNQYSILHWLTILLQNRTFDISSPLAIEAKEYLLTYFNVNYEDYDIIVGYRADDSYFSFAQDFINGTISLRQLQNAMHLGNLGKQYVLKSKKAFSKIKFIESFTVSNRKWYDKKMQRDKQARRQYFDVERHKRKKGDLFIMQIIDEEMMPNDPRLR